MFSSVALLVYAAGVAAVVHAFVRLYKEPTLSITYGEEYAAYCANVARWIPRLSLAPPLRDNGDAPVNAFFSSKRKACRGMVKAGVAPQLWKKRAAERRVAGNGDPGLEMAGWNTAEKPAAHAGELEPMAGAPTCRGPAKAKECTNRKRFDGRSDPPSPRPAISASPPETFKTV